MGTLRNTTIWDAELRLNFYARIFGIFWKCARVGERLSPYVSICCVVMAVSVRIVLFGPQLTALSAGKLDG